MKKNYTTNFHYLLKYYNKCVRKYQRLKNSNVNANRLQFLTKRIDQTLSKILVFVPRLKKQISMAALAGSFLLISQNSNGQITFGPQQVNPFGLTQFTRVNGVNGFLSQSVLVDIDNDGDLDIIENNWGTGTYDGETRFFENIGNSTSPNFAASQANPFSIQTGKYELFDYVDLDNDGDLDLFTLETSNTTFKFFENIGTASSPNFAAPVNNPFGISTSQSLNSPEFADFDNDGDFDLMFFGYAQDVSYFENIGTASSPSFASEVVDPFGLVIPAAHYYNRLAIADLDQDGDFDIMMGSGFYGDLTYFENTGTSSNPNFVAGITNPFGIDLNVEQYTTCSFGDINNDGKLDILTQKQNVSGVLTRDFIIFENTSPSSAGLIESNLEINVYPNPFEDVINIHVNENTRASLSNVLGKEIKSFNLVSGNNVVDVANLPAGVYLLQDFKSKFSQRVIKK